MAKKSEPKKNEKKKQLTSIPMTIAGLTGGGDLSEITKSVNSGLLDRKDPKPEEEKPSTPQRGGGAGRPRKATEAIVEASGDTEWERFMDYTSQFYNKNYPTLAVYVHEDIRKFFMSMKLVCGPTADLKSMVNATLRLFMDKYKDEINDRIRKELMGG